MPASLKNLWRTLKRIKVDKNKEQLMVLGIPCAGVVVADVLAHCIGEGGGLFGDGMCLAITSDSILLTSSDGQVANLTRMPLFNTQSISFMDSCGFFGKHESKY